MCLFRELDADWRHLTSLRTSQVALARWGEAHPALRPYHSLVALLSALRNGDGLPYAERDALLRDLIAITDRLAARVVLQAILPALVVTARDDRHLGLQREDVDAEIVAVAWEMIRVYPLARRPRHVAANLVLDIRKVVRLRRRGQAAETAAITSLWARFSSDGDDATAELVELLGEGLRRGFINSFEASLIARTRIGDERIEVIAAETCRQPQSIRRRRSRAEHSLAKVAQ